MAAASDNAGLVYMNWCIVSCGRLGLMLSWMSGGMASKVSFAGVPMILEAFERALDQAVRDMLKESIEE
jgi:hypothetical protein